jgi:hypothetical protein
VVELRGDENAVAVSNDLAARDLGLVGEIVSSFSSRIHVVTNFVDSTPCSGVSKRPRELKMPLPASIR